MASEVVFQKIASASVPTPPTGYQGLFVDSTGAILMIDDTGGFIAFTGLVNPMTAAGDVIIGGTAGAPARLAIGTASQLLAVVSGTPAWVDGSTLGFFSNPMTTAGDIIVGGASGAGTRLAAGTASQLLAIVSGAPAWSDAASLGLAALAGANVFVDQQAVTPYRANISGAVSIDLAATAKSNNLHLTLTGNVTSFALTNPVDGAVYNFRFIQDATGSRTFAGFPAAFKFSGGVAPSFSTAANAVDFMSAEYGATEGTYMCSFLPNMA